VHSIERVREALRPILDVAADAPDEVGIIAATLPLAPFSHREA
jgi:hypothetical protein